MFLRNMSNILEPTVSTSDTGAGPSLLRLSLLPVEWRDYILPIHSILLTCLKQTFKRHNQSDVLFVQLGDPHIRVHFGVVHNGSATLLVNPLFIERFVKRVVHMKRFIGTVRSPTISINSEYTPRWTNWLKYRAARKLRPIRITDMEKCKVTAIESGNVWPGHCQIQTRLYQLRPVTLDSSTKHQTQRACG